MLNLLKNGEHIDTHPQPIQPTPKGTLGHGLQHANSEASRTPTRARRAHSPRRLQHAPPNVGKHLEPSLVQHSKLAAKRYCFSKPLATTPKGVNNIRS
jgi:hypothetical protein